jgi:hypothetical protein
MTALGGLGSSLLSCGAPLLIWISFFPYPTIFSFFWQPLLDELILISKHQLNMTGVDLLVGTPYYVKKRRYYS